MSAPARYAMALLIGAALGAWGAWYLAGLKADRLERDRLRDTLKVINAAQDETIRLQGIKDAALEKANRRAQANANAAADARGELDGLRHDLADARARLPTLSHQACLVRAAALDAVFSHCAGVAEDLARKAGGHANDAMTLNEAWPDDGNGE